MTFWAEVFLGIIALATLTMAVIQVGLIAYGWTLARRLDRVLTEIERDIRPLADSVNAVVRDAARASSLAVSQVERVDSLLTEMAARFEQTASTMQDAIVRPLRNGAAMMAGVKAVVEVVREMARRPGDRKRSEEEEALFIG